MTPRLRRLLLRLLDAATFGVSRIVRDAVERVLRIWRRTDPFNGPQVRVFTELAGQISVGMQRQVADVHTVVQTRVLRELGVPVPAVLPVVPDDVRAAARARAAAAGLPPKPRPEPKPEPAPERGSELLPDPVVREQPRPAGVQRRPEPVRGPERTVVDAAPRELVRTAPAPVERVAEPVARPAAQAVREQPRTTTVAPRETAARGQTSTLVAPREQPRRGTESTVVEGVRQQFDRPARVYQARLADGVAAEEAQREAERQIERVLEDQAMLAQAEAEAVVLDAVDDKIDGWRRIIHPELSMGGVCGLCVAASDRIYTRGDLKALHERCKCTVLPIVDGVDPGRSLNEEDLKRLYEDAGSTSGRAKKGAPGLKRTRYKVMDDGKLGAVFVPEKGERVGRATTRTPADGQGEQVPVNLDAQQERDRRAVELATALLPVLEENLAGMLARGMGEDSEPVKYHRREIAHHKRVLGR